MCSLLQCFTAQHADFPIATAWLDVELSVLYSFVWPIPRLVLGLAVLCSKAFFKLQDGLGEGNIKRPYNMDRHDYDKKTSP